MKKNIIVLIFLALTISMYGQVEKLDNYKYAVVDNQFNFLKNIDQYQTSSLTKFLVAKTGITTFLKGEEIPLKYLSESCEGIYVSVTEDSSLFKTRNRIEFKDCSGTTVFFTKYGVSNEKDFGKAYSKAIRNAFNSISNYVYNYKEKAVSSKKIPIANTSFEANKDTKKIKKVKETTETLYAQPRENGFQLVNDKPEVVFFLIETEKEGVFIIKDKNGLFYKKGSSWFAETYKNGKTTIKLYDINF
jgi:hypothetical protein